MPTYTKIKIRRDTTSNWTAVNPVLDLGEIGADMTKHGLKVGNGTSKWTELPFCSPELVNDLIAGGTDKALTAEQGKILKALVDQKVDSTTLDNAINNLRDELNTQITSMTSSGGGPAVLDQQWSSTSKTDALSANSGRILKDLAEGKADQDDIDEINDQIAEINDKIDGLGIFGMGYTIEEWNGNDKPTKIRFEDGVVCTLTYHPGDIAVNTITASSGEVMTILYDPDHRIIGRTITR